MPASFALLHLVVWTSNHTDVCITKCIMKKNKRSDYYLGMNTFIKLYHVFLNKLSISKEIDTLELS